MTKKIKKQDELSYDSTEFIWTLVIIGICDFLLGFLLYNLQEFPLWAGYLTYALFNISCGMVIMAQFINQYQYDKTK